MIMWLPGSEIGFVRGQITFFQIKEEQVSIIIIKKSCSPPDHRAQKVSEHVGDFQPQCCQWPWDSLHEVSQLQAALSLQPSRCMEEIHHKTERAICLFPKTKRYSLGVHQWRPGLPYDTARTYTVSEQYMCMFSYTSDSWHAGSKTRDGKLGHRDFLSVNCIATTSY